MGLDMSLYGVKDNSPEGDLDNSYGEWKELGYWRKANHVHKWFNDNIIKRQDPWGLYMVEENKLQGLLVLCKVLKKIKENDFDILETELLEIFKKHRKEWKFDSGDNGDYIAYALLPPDNMGCCFGSGVVDEWYWQDIDETIDILTKAIESDYNTYYYRASW